MMHLGHPSVRLAVGNFDGTTLGDGQFELSFDAGVSFAKASLNPTITSAIFSLDEGIARNP